MADQFNILDYTAGPLMKTGQTTNYTPAGRTSQDDGGQQIGIAGSKFNGQYVVLTTAQYAGTTNITIGAQTDIHSNECVFDKVTGLMWNRAANAAVFGALNNEDLFWFDAVNSQDIFNYCDLANLAGLSGFNNWRLPNILEVRSLQIFETPNARPNQTIFPTIANNIVWSSTSVASAPVGNAYSATFLNGTVSQQNKTTLRNKCILVRNP